MKKVKTLEQSLDDIDKLYEKLEQEKEDRLIDLIVEIIVSSTMRVLILKISLHPTLKKMNNS